MTRFHNKTILVTGAGTGIGRATALRLAEERARVLLVGRRSAPLEAVAGEVAARGAVAEIIICDIADEAAIGAMADHVSARYGGIDGLFVNAGILGPFNALTATPTGDFETLVRTNLLGSFLTIRRLLPLLAGGAIVVNTSWTVNAVMPGAGAYAATKAALANLVRTLAVEEGPRGVRVNGVSPGVVLTPMAAEALDPALVAKLAAHAPLKRTGAPEDIADPVAWLLSDDARFVTGQDIVVDGGFTIAGPRF